MTKRSFFNWTARLLTIMSLIAALSTAVAWIHSYTAQDVLWIVGWQHQHTDDGDMRRLIAETRSANGRIRIHIPPSGTAEVAASLCDDSKPYRLASAPPRPGNWSPLSSAFMFIHEGVNLPRSDPPLRWWIGVPHWALFVVFMIMPVVWTAQRIGAAKRHRAARGLCVRCGYDLRATPDRCPECGTDAHRGYHLQ
jgi:hypothetical protein